MKAKSPVVSSAPKIKEPDGSDQPIKKNTKVNNEKRIITFSWVQVGAQTDEVSVRAEAERAVSRSMCLPVVINGAQAGLALIDQGATRSVMRQSAYDRLKGRMHKRTPLKEVNNMYVVGSTNELVPVVGVFVADLYTQQQQHICNTVIYVADDMNGKDIVCDMILGRSSIATSRYAGVDTRHNGALVSLDDPSRETIQCFQGEFETDENAKSQLTLTGDEAPDAVFPLAHVCLHKIRALSAVVSQRDKLNDKPFSLFCMSSSSKPKPQTRAFLLSALLDMA